MGSNSASLSPAIAKQADLFLLDEPFAGVDKKTEQVMFAVFGELKAQNKTLLIVNHDLSENLRHYDRLVLLNRRLIAVGNQATVMTADNLARAYGLS